MKDLQKQAEEFGTLIDNAFSSNFRDSFLHSIILAQSIGVSNKDLLVSTEEIDDFFLN